MKLAFCSSEAGAKSSGFRLRRSSISGWREPNLGLLMLLSTSVSSFFKCNSRVNDLIQNIDDEVHKNNERSEENSRTHYKGIVTVEYALNKITSQPRYGEHGFDNEATAENKGDLRSEVGNNGDECVSQSVLKDNGGVFKTLRSRRLDLDLSQ